MTTTRKALEALSMDLVRIADCIRKGSLRTGERFRKEALRWHGHIQMNEVPPVLHDHLTSLEEILNTKQGNELAEKAHSYSIILHAYLENASK